MANEPSEVSLQVIIVKENFNCVSTQTTELEPGSLHENFQLKCPASTWSVPSPHPAPLVTPRDSVSSISKLAKSSSPCSKDLVEPLPVQDTTVVAPSVEAAIEPLPFYGMRGRSGPD